MAELAEAALKIAGTTALTEISKQSVSSANRSVIIHLFNSSADILLNPQVYTYSGYCYDPPKPTVRHGITDVCAFGNVFTDLLTSGFTDFWDSEHKLKTKRGAVGVLTYDIVEPQRMKAVKRLAVMFSVPFNYIFYENWFALGLFNINQACDCALYKHMYYQKGKFTRGRASGSEICYQDRKYTLKGTMSPMAKAEMKVELI